MQNDELQNASYSFKLIHGNGSVKFVRLNVKLQTAYKDLVVFHQIDAPVFRKIAIVFERLLKRVYIIDSGFQVILELEDLKIKFNLLQGLELN